MKCKYGYLFTGEIQVRERAIDAAKRAFSYPNLLPENIDKTTHILFNLVSGPVDSYNGNFE